MSGSILDNVAVTHALRELPGWQHTGDIITKTFVQDDFRSAIRFVNRVAGAAEAANHHPDIDIRWNKVTLALTIHSADGLTSNDTTLAHRIQRLVGDHHHPPGMAGP
jgi:4a-hydroxytetrahydrobiopterin dehydratase